MLQEMLQQISPLDSAAMETARQHWDAIAKPLHSLGRLEDLVVQLAGITGTANLPPRKKAVLIFCADNGVVAEGVTPTTLPPLPAILPWASLQSTPCPVSAGQMFFPWTSAWRRNCTATA